MSSWLVDKAKTGDKVTLTGPMGVFYLRPIERPILMLAGGTGLAPLLAQLEYIKAIGCSGQPIHLIYGVTNDDDLVCLAQLEKLAEELDNFSFRPWLPATTVSIRSRVMSPIIWMRRRSTTVMWMCTCVARRQWWTPCSVISGIRASIRRRSITRSLPPVLRPMGKRSHEITIH